MSGGAVSGRDGSRRLSSADARRPRRSAEGVSTKQTVKLVGTIMGFITVITLATFLLSFVVFLAAS